MRWAAAHLGERQDKLGSEPPMVHRPSSHAAAACRRLAWILRKRAIRKHSPHIFKAGQKQPPEFRIQVEGIFGPQPVEAIMRMLTEHRVERHELEVGWKRQFI